MKYKITITKEVENPDYDEKVANQGLYNQRYDEAYKINKVLEIPALTVDLTEDEFKAIKKAVLEVM